MNTQLTPEERELVGKYLKSLLYQQRSVIRTANSFMGTAKEPFAKHVLTHYPHKLHLHFVLVKKIGYKRFLPQIHSFLREANLTIDQLVENSKNLHCFDQAVLSSIPTAYSLEYQFPELQQ